MSDVEQVPALAAVEAAVLAVPGVAEVYRARPTLQSTVAAVRHATEAARVVLDGDVLRVVIGTDGVLPAPQVARAVHHAVLAQCAEHGLTLARVDVRIARVG
ncbi:hypothetical protein EDF24_1696 [Curtobacterium sp. PhB130]|uniref:hypothetical protein n=1 Tax=Curtobacterium sp. PhB130 TaxID=2485178 RepID=UPI000F99668E|nr:hypothetical protein [Curtobacterium sp. PhB130]ROS76115.1 hypothetical protein EDF24_1696 [Curtobacterium sp. PhB130]